MIVMMTLCLGILSSIKIFQFFIKNKIIRLIMENILHRRGAVMHKNPVRQLHDTHNVISSH